MNNFGDLKGKVLVNVENFKDEELIFTLENGEMYKLHHIQECCESVRVEDVNGNLGDLIGSPILLAEETSSQAERPNGVHLTWTFYRLATLEGYVTVRWYGESNGYYSESVDFDKV